MTHSDDDGLVLPPRLAPQHVVILPIFRSDDEKARVLEYCRKVAAELRAQRFHDAPVRVLVDERDERGGEKVWHWVKKGVPLRLEIGPRDMEKDAVFAGRRDRAPKDKQSVARTEFVAQIAATLQSIQDGLLARAKAFRERAHAAHRQPRRVLRVLHDRARGGGQADADSRRLRADPLQRRGRAREEDQGRPVRDGALHPARQERARHVPVHGQAERAARRLGQGLLTQRAATRRRGRGASDGADAVSASCRRRAGDAFRDRRVRDRRARARRRRQLRGWRFVNGWWFRLAHLAAIAVVVAQAWLGVVCPLTTLESWLRVQAGEAAYETSFIEHWLTRILFYDAPAWVFTAAYTLFGGRRRGVVAVPAGPPAPRSPSFSATMRR